MLREYSTRPACLDALAIARKHFRDLELAIPAAEWVPWDNDFNWRFVEKLPAQLLLQKLARQITGVATLDLLLMAGHLQEIGVLYRTLDEIHEDVIFVSLGMRPGNWTSNHDAYIQHFWSEDDADKQPPVRRKSVRAYVNRAFDLPDPSGADAIGRKIHKTYSDYAHARSAPIMAMVHGPPAIFDLDGIHEEAARLPYVQQHPAYFYRCLVSANFIANIILSDFARALLFDELKAFEKDHVDLLF